MVQATCEDLFERYRGHGDVAALAELIDRVEPILMRTGSRLEADPTRVEDAAQQAFLSAIEHADRYEAGRPLIPWLVGILANQLRAERRRGRPVDPAGLERIRPVDPQQNLSNRELVEQVGVAVASLPPTYKMVVLLKLQQDLRPSEIARMLGRSRSTVRSQLARGLQMLRDSLPAGVAGVAAVALLPRRGIAMQAEVLASAWRRTHVLRRGPLTTPAAKCLLGALSAVFVLGGGLALVRHLGAEAESLPSGDPPARLGPPASGGRRPRAGEVAAEESPAPAARGAAPRAAPTGLVAAATSQNDARLRVTLLARDGAPVPDAAVVLSRPGSSRVRITDARGVAEMRLAGLGGPETAMVFVPRALGAEMRDDVELRPGEVCERVVEVPGGHEVRGRVLRPDGLPAAGARIWAGPVPTHGHVVTRADAEGRFRLTAIPPNFYVGARSAVFSPSPVEHLPARKPGEPIGVTLRLGGPAGAVEGEVVTADGRPADWAMVTLGVAAREIPRASGVRSFEVAHVTRLRGRNTFRLEGVAPGSHPLRVESMPLATATETVTVTAHETTSVLITLRPGATLEGRVTDEAGRAVPFAQVERGELYAPIWPAAVADENGWFRVQGIPPGEQLIRVVSESGDSRAFARLRFAEDAKTEWNPLLRSRVALRGRLVDAAGLPLRDHAVHALSAVVQFERSVWLVTGTDERGEFSFDGCDPACSYRVEARNAAGRLLAVRDHVLPTCGPLVLEADGRCRRSAALEGKVAGSSRVHHVELAGVDFVRQAGREPGRGGIFRFDDLEPGRYLLRTRGEDGLGPWLGPFRVEDEETRRLGDLARAAPDGSIDDLVLLTLMHARVVVFDLDETPGRTRGGVREAPIIQGGLRESP